MFGLNHLVLLGIAFAEDESGATAIEYALLVALISVAGVTMFFRMGSSMDLMYNGIIAPLVTAALGG